MFAILLISACVLNHSVVTSKAISKNDTTDKQTDRITDEEELTCSTVISSFDEDYADDIECQNNEVCTRTFKLSGVDLMPYSLSREVEELLIKCCGMLCTFDGFTAPLK